jgi:hypothetical protein
MLTDTLIQSALAVAAATGVEEAAQDAVFARIKSEWDRRNRAVDGGDENPAQYSNDNG